MSKSENILKKYEIAYTAGLLDGEGSIVIGLSKRKRKHGISNHYWLQVGITGTNINMINWLHNKFGGHISNSSHCKSRRKQRPCWAWRIMSNQAVDFLKKLLPFLIDKKDRAILAIEFQESINKDNRKRLTQKVIDERQWYKDEISSMNTGYRTI